MDRLKGGLVMQQMVRRMRGTSSASNSHRKAAFLFALIVLLADLSGMALAQDTTPDEASIADIPMFEDPILIDSLPPLMCEEELCLRPTRMIDRGDRPSAEDGIQPHLDYRRRRRRPRRILEVDHRYGHACI